MNLREVPRPEVGVAKTKAARGQKSKTRCRRQAVKERDPGEKGLELSEWPRWQISQYGVSKDDRSRRPYTEQ